MSKAILEHVNVTVTDPERTAQMLCSVFGWEIRWQGPSIHGGRTVHVGNADDYLAVYAQGADAQGSGESYTTQGGLNHIGVLVDALDETEQRVQAAGLKPFNHQTYNPGKRFYFLDFDGIEYEVVSYAA